MRAEAMLPMLEDLDAAGYDAIEFAVPTAQFSRAVKDLREDPWDWLALGSARVTRTPLRLHGHAKSPFTEVPPSMQGLLLDEIAALGMTTTRTSDSWNDMAKLAGTVTMLAEHGLSTVVNVIYSVSPRHTTDYFAQKVRDAAALRPPRICFKDVGGLLTPERARELFPIVVESAGDIEVEFHGHCSNGFAGYSALIAADSGVRAIHTAIPPLANGGSQPSVFTVVENLRARGYHVPLDLEPLRRVSEHLQRVARVEGLPSGAVAEYRESQYAHQVPGGMVSNLVFQLEQLGMAHRLDEALDEAGRVRADLGYPIMVTPLAQFVGSQATMNVITGTRYGTVTDEVIQYALGKWGAEAPDVMDPEIRALILDRPRAAELAELPGGEPPSLEEMRGRFVSGISNRELLTRVFANAGAGPLDFRPSPPADLDYEGYRKAHDSTMEVIRTAVAEADLMRFAYQVGDVEVAFDRGAR